MAAEVQIGDMIATSYYRKPGSSMLSGESGSWGALVQTVAMRGSLKGRCCRHQHPTSAEAVDCAHAMIAIKAQAAA